MTETIASEISELIRERIEIELDLHEESYSINSDALADDIVAIVSERWRDTQHHPVIIGTDEYYYRDLIARRMSMTPLSQESPL